MVNHDMMWLILRKFGIPNNTIEVIKKVYADCQIEILIEGITKLVEYTKGIQQGDNMSPPLCIYVMRVAMETFEKLDEKRKKSNYKFFPNQKGRLTNQPMKTFKGTESFNVSDIHFINDITIICEMRNDIEIISQSILSHLTKFGLQMHMGNKQNKSKLEAIYFP